MSSFKNLVNKAEGVTPTSGVTPTKQKVNGCDDTVMHLVPIDWKSIKSGSPGQYCPEHYKAVCSRYTEWTGNTIVMVKCMGVNSDQMYEAMQSCKRLKQMASIIGAQLSSSISNIKIVSLFKTWVYTFIVLESTYKADIVPFFKGCTNLDLLDIIYNIGGEITPIEKYTKSNPGWDTIIEKATRKMGRYKSGHILVFSINEVPVEIKAIWKGTADFGECVNETLFPLFRDTLNSHRIMQAACCRHATLRDFEMYKDNIYVFYYTGDFNEYLEEMLRKIFDVNLLYSV